MTDWLESLKDSASLFVDNKIFLGGVGGFALLSASGAMPRVGLVRALTLGWRSYFKTTYPLSVRKSEIQRCDRLLKCMHRGSYIVVTGWKGIGKTCLIDTVLNRRQGVVKITAGSGDSKSDIVDEALRAITGIHWSCCDPADTAHRVLFFYSCFFKNSPIVSIRVSDRQAGDRYASVTAAVRQLADDFGVRVIVDGRPHSLPPELLCTIRETEIAVEPLSREQIEAIPELEGLLDFLKARQLDDAVWKVLGGSPIHYLNLKSDIHRERLQSKTDDEVAEAVKNHLHSLLSKALNRDICNSSATTTQIIKIFREKQILKMSLSKLAAMGLLLEESIEVFREVKTREGYHVEPTSAAIALIIAENVQNDADVPVAREAISNHLLRPIPS